MDGADTDERDGIGDLDSGDAEQHDEEGQGEQGEGEQGQGEQGQREQGAAVDSSGDHPTLTCANPADVLEAGCLVVTVTVGETGESLTGVPVELSDSTGAGTFPSPIDVAFPPGPVSATLTDAAVPAPYLRTGPGTQTATVSTGNTTTIAFVVDKDGAPVPPPGPNGPDPSGTLTVTKKDRVTGAHLTGATFEVRPCAGGNGGADLHTDANRTASASLSSGCWRVTETGAPVGYEPDGVTWDVDIKPEATAGLTVFNLPQHYVWVRDPVNRVPLRSIPSGRTR